MHISSTFLFLKFIDMRRKRGPTLIFELSNAPNSSFYHALSGVLFQFLRQKIRRVIVFGRGKTTDINTTIFIYLYLWEKRNVQIEV